MGPNPCVEHSTGELDNGATSKFCRPSWMGILSEIGYRSRVSKGRVTLYNKPHESSCYLQFPTISCFRVGGHGVSEACMVDPSSAAQVCFMGALWCCSSRTCCRPFHESEPLPSFAGLSAGMWPSISHRFSYGLRFRFAAEEHADHHDSERPCQKSSISAPTCISVGLP